MLNQLFKSLKYIHASKTKEFIKLNIKVLLLPILFLLIPNAVYAQSMTDRATGIINEFLTLFENSISSISIIQTYAERLFWILAFISFVWTFLQLAIKKADLSDFFGELIKFCMVIGFFWWILQNGSDIVEAITKSLTQMANSVPGKTPVKEISDVIRKGVELSDKLIGVTEIEGGGFNLIVLIQSIIFFILIMITALVVLMVFAVITVDLMVLKIGLWFLAYGGIFLLAFGATNYTKDIAIQYYKVVIAQAVQMFVLIIIVAVGASTVEVFVNKFAEQDIFQREYIVVFMVIGAVLVLYLLSKELPQLVSGIIAQGNLGAGRAIAGTATALGVATAGGGNGWQ